MSKLLTVLGGKQAHFWDALNTGYVVAGGLPPNQWLTNNASSINGCMTLIDTSPVRAIRQTGTITRITWMLKAGNVLQAAKLCVFRPLGSGTYRLISETASLTPAQGSTTTEVSLECRVGDVWGLKVYDDGVDSTVSCSNLGSPNLVMYKNVDATGDVSGWSSLANYGLNICGYCDPPLITVIGDSISKGGSYWSTHKSTTGYDVVNLDPVNDPAYQIASRLGADGLTYQNHGAGSRTWAGVLSTDAVLALATLPRVLYCHCGVNDLATPRALEDVLANMDSVKALVDAQAQPCTMVVAEILPWTNGTDEQAATVRTWNAAYATWCVANSVPLVRVHDPLGQTRAATGYLDDLLAAYDDDGVHLVPAGTAAMGAVAAARLRNVP